MMIKLKNVLSEQNNKFNAKAIANKIYNAKGYVYDNEQDAINIIKLIKNTNQLEQVEQQFVKLSKGRTLSEYLISFLNNFYQNLSALKHLYSISKNNFIALNSVVYPYAAEMLYEYKLDIAKVGDSIRKKNGRRPVGLKDYGSLFKWFKPYLGETNFNKWVPIVQNPKYRNNPFNAYQPEEQFKYGETKAVSSDIILLGQTIIGVIATVATYGSAAPAAAGWIGLGTTTSMGLYDAAQEYNLGNKQTAGIMATIEMLPFVSKIPGVKQLVRTVGKSLATKLAKGVKYLTSQERFLVTQLFKNNDAIEAELKKVSKQSKILEQFNTWLNTQSDYSQQQIKTMLQNGDVTMETIVNIDKTALDKAIRMLNQTPKFKDLSAIDRYKAFVERIKGIAIHKHDPNLGSASSLSGTAGVGLSGSSKHGILTLPQIQYIARHEMDHLYRNTPEEAAEWIKAFDLSKVDTKTQRYFNTPHKQVGITTPDDPFGINPANDLRYNTYDELRARAGQLKDYISLKKGIPLSKDFKITIDDLNDAIENYIKDVGLDNNMSSFFKSIKDKNILLRNMNKYALGTAGLITIGKLSSAPNLTEQHIKLKSLI
jgi:hypothetical protein